MCVLFLSLFGRRSFPSLTFLGLITSPGVRLRLRSSCTYLCLRLRLRLRSAAAIVLCCVAVSRVCDLVLSATFLTGLVWGRMSNGSPQCALNSLPTFSSFPFPIQFSPGPVCSSPSPVEQCPEASPVQSSPSPVPVPVQLKVSRCTPYLPQVVQSSAVCLRLHAA